MDQRYATGKKPTPSSHGERARYLNHELDGPSRFGNEETYRAELLQKLDELKDHLSRSCEVAEPRIGTNMMIPPVLNEAYSRNHAGFIQERMTRSYGGYRSSGLRDLHFHQGYRYEFQSCNDYQQEMAQRPFEEARSPYLHQPYHDLFVPNRDFHKNTCSCVHCIDQDLDLHVITPFSYNRISRGLTTELKFGNGGIHQNCSSKTEEARRRGHMMLPFAGGAPFVACSTCFELLKLPIKRISSAKRQQKLKCGACSSIIPFELERKASTVPVVTEMDDFHSVVVDKNSSSNIIDPNPCSSYSNTDPPPQNLPLPNTLSSEKNGSSTAEVESFPHPTLSTEKCTDHSPDVVVEQRDSGAKDTKSELNNNVPWQDSVKDSAVSTEIDVPSKEFSKSSVTMDSIDTIKERLVRDEKGAESSTAGNAAGFIVMAENVEVGSSQVFVNRHLIPEHLVQKAELLAGPIQPGDYWYDTRAGFWGVMGFPCLGIIMPNIKNSTTQCQ